MQLPWDTHFDQIVIPAWQAYLAAERNLTEAQNRDVASVEQAHFRALREGGAATFYVHHFTDVVLRAKPAWLPYGITNIADEGARLGATRKWVAQRCTMLRSANIDDVSLLHDVADALKHAILTGRRNRDVSKNDQVLVVATGYGKLRYGEGKFGGTEQVLVLANSGTRALSSVLQNVIDAWRLAAGRHLPNIGQP
jgi:hypothetical protein